MTCEDFQEVCQHNLATVKTNNLRNHLSKTYKFIDYAPNVFHKLRTHYGISSFEYIRSLGVENMLNSLLMSEFTSLQELITTGKSGSFFYYSSDGNYMLKTINKSEFKFIRKIIGDYYGYVINNSDTFITRFFGLHEIVTKKRYGRSRIYFICMANLFHAPFTINQRYDLKGSSVGRVTDPKEDITVARKDLDWLNQEMKIQLGPKRAEEFLTQLQKDCDFFMHLNIIDYSLLIGIHDRVNKAVPPHEQVRSHIWAERDDGGVLSSDRKKLYFIGIIDILTEYNWKKRGEHFAKSIRYNSTEISCIPPSKYAERFLSFISQQVV